MNKSFWSLCAWFCLTVSACTSGEVDPPSRYEGELGADCESAEDCQEGLRCSTDLSDDPATIFRCYVPCAQDGTCPEGSTCIVSYVSPSRGEEGVERRMCERLCEDKDFCIELNPNTNDCDTFSNFPNSPEICGYRG
jgi:hypothetical protein